MKLWSRPARQELPRLSATFVYQAIIVLAVLALSILLARRPSMLLVYIGVGAIAAYAALRQPWLGPLAVVIAGLLIRITIGTGTQSSLHLVFVIVPASLVLWAVKGLMSRELALAPSRTTLPLIGLAVTSIVALVAGNLSWIPFAQGAPLRSQLGGLGIILISIGAFFIMANQVRTVRQLQAVTWTFLVIGGLYLVSRALGIRDIVRVYHTGALGSVFWIMLVALAAGQALFNSRLWPGWRLALIGLVGLAFAISMTGPAREWASGWLPPLAALGMVIFLRWPRAGLLLGVVGVLLAPVLYPIVQPFLLAGNEYSLLTRQAAIEIVLRIAAVSPLFGLGPANYYFYTPLVPILGWYVSFNSHNQFADIIAQTGLLGLAFVLWIFAEAARTGWQQFRKQERTFAHGYAAACLAAIVGILISGMLGDWFLPFVYNTGTAALRASVLGWLFLGGLVALARLAPKSASPPD